MELGTSRHVGINSPKLGGEIGQIANISPPDSGGVAPIHSSSLSMGKHHEVIGDGVVKPPVISKMCPDFWVFNFGYFLNNLPEILTLDMNQVFPLSLFP
jgi:hypothetical protein